MSSHRNQKEKTTDLNTKLENDEYIKKYHHLYYEYESLEFFNFENPSTKSFCENLITLKIKLRFALKFSLILLTTWICGIILFCFLKADFISDKQGLFIAAVCFIVIGLAMSFFSLFLFQRLDSLTNLIISFDEIKKVPDLYKIKKIVFVYFLTFGNLLCFGFISATYLFLKTDKIMQHLSKNLELLSISKKSN